MVGSELIRVYMEYHLALTRRVWEAMAALTDEQFVQEDGYSQGSIRNLMVHLASTDRRWLAGLKNQPDVGHLNLADYPSRAAGRAVFEQVAQELADYTAALTEAELAQPANGMDQPRWQILLHLVNHGTDHRATVLERLHALGAPTFPQDFVIWLWNRSKK
jgi:uncharacterized damage-inducible protein DinB